MLSNTLRLNFCYLKIIHILHTGYHPKLMGHILKNKQKNNCACIREIIRSIIKMKMKMRSHRYDINRPRSRHEQKYSKYKKCLMMMLICIEKYLSDAQLTWRSIQEKIKQRWGFVEKKCCLQKNRVLGDQDLQLSSSTVEILIEIKFSFYAINGGIRRDRDIVPFQVRIFYTSAVIFR